MPLIARCEIMSDPHCVVKTQWLIPLERYEFMASKDKNQAVFAPNLTEFIPHLSVDCVVFGFHAGELKLLLLKWMNSEIWALPGGYVGLSESLDKAARRILKDRTGLGRIKLQQFHAFGGLRRQEGVWMRKLLAATGLKAPKDPWPLQRVVSVGYYALVDFRKVRPKPDALSEACAWFPVDEHPKLAFDHGEIVSSALEALRSSLSSPWAGATLLPERFTMPELQRLHEAILGKSLDRRNFQKRMLERGGLERLDEQRTGGAHRAPYLYRFTAGED
jgi:8-oxo-dGTP diphosphatase